MRRRPGSVVAVVVSVFFALKAVMTSVADGLFGNDFAVFHAGATLIGRDGYDAAYDSERFGSFLRSEYLPSLGERNVTHFISPPPFGWASQILTTLPFSSSLAVWLVVGFLVLIPASRMLGLPAWAPLALIVSPPIALNTTLGQTGAFVLLLFAAIHVCHRDNQLILGGVFAGLIILKPVLALGYGLLWIVQFRRYWKSMAVSAVVGLLVSIPTLLAGFGPWQGFLDAMSARTELESDWAQQAYSAPEFIKGLFPLSPSWVTLVGWGVGLIVGLALIMLGHRRFGDDAEVMSAIAVIATVVVSPHLLVYDSLILIIPAAVAYSRGYLTGDRAGTLAAIVVVAVVFSPPLHIVQYGILQSGFQLEFPALMLCTWLLYRWHSEALEQPTSGTPSSPATESVAVLTDS